MKVTKTTFFGQESRADMRDKPIFRVVGGIPPVPPTKGNPGAAD